MKHWPFTVIDAGTLPKLQVEYKNEKKTFTPEKVSSMMLTKMKETVESYLRQDVKDAIVIVPAYFDNSQHQATSSNQLGHPPHMPPEARSSRPCLQ